MYRMRLICWDCEDVQTPWVYGSKAAPTVRAFARWLGWIVDGPWHLCPDCHADALAEG